MSSPVNLTDEQYLDMAQALRHDLVNNLITDESGKRALPSDSDTVNSIKGLLKDMDSSVFTKKRLTVEETAAENDKRAAELLSKVAAKIGGPRRIDDPIEGEVVHLPNVDDLQLPEFDIPVEALETECKEINVEEIVEKERIRRKGEE